MQSRSAFAAFRQGFGTHEDILVEILATRSNQEIREIKRVFNEGLARFNAATHCKLNPGAGWALSSWKALTFAGTVDGLTFKCLRCAAVQQHSATAVTRCPKHVLAQSDVLVMLFVLQCTKQSWRRSFRMKPVVTSPRPSWPCWKQTKTRARKSTWVWPKKTLR